MVSNQTFSSLDCEEVRPLLAEYFEGATSLSKSERLAIGHHIRECVECQQEYQEEKEIVSFLRTHKEEPGQELERLKREDEMDDLEGA